VRSSVDRAAAF